MERPQLDESHADALRDLQAELEMYLHCCMSSRSSSDSEDDPGCEAILDDHPVKLAVIRVEEFYPGKLLPVELRFYWKELLAACRSGKRKPDSVIKKAALDFREAVQMFCRNDEHVAHSVAERPFIEQLSRQDFSRWPVSERPRVKLFGRGDPPVVNGRQKRTLSKAQYDVVLALLEASDEGLTKDKLDRKSKHTEARKILRRLAVSDTDWESVIVFPEKPGKGYRIR